MKRFIITLLAFGTLLFLVSIPLLMPLAKAIRAQQHLSNAIEAKEQEDHRLALFKLQSAHNLSREDPEILSLLGPYAAEVYSPYTLEYWTHAAELDILDLDSTIAMIEYGLQVGQADTVRPYLFQVARSQPDDARVKALQMQFLQNERRDAESRSLARELVQQADIDVGIVASYVQSTFASPQSTEEEQAEAIGTLMELSRGEDDIGIYALRVLLRLWDRMDEDSRQRVEAALQAHPQAQLPDRLDFLSRRKAEDVDPTDILERGRTAYEQALGANAGEGEIPDDTYLLNVFVTWLSQSGYHEAVLEYLPDPEAIRNPNIYFLYMAALTEAGQAEQARDLTFKDNPLSPTRNLVVRALTHSSLGQQDKVRPNLELAIENVHPREVTWLEDILLRANAADLAVSLYEHLERQSGNPLSARLRLMQYYYLFGREADLQRVVESTNPESFSGFLSQEVAVLYYLTLYAEDTARIRRHLEDLLDDYPLLIEPRVFLAFAYGLAGKPDIGLDLISGWERHDFTGNRSFLIMLADIHLRAGDGETARELAAKLPMEDLLDKERALLSPLL